MKFNSFLFAIVALLLATSINVADDWNQWLGPNRNSMWQESGVITEIPASGLNVVWRSPVSRGFSGPAVSGNRVFVSDYVATSGNQAFNPGRRNKLTGSERVLCFDVKTGEQLWEHKYECKYNYK